MPEHYAVVARALLWTLKKGLGASFDQKHELAWTKVYGVLSETMQSGAQEIIPPLVQGAPERSVRGEN